MKARTLWLLVLCGLVIGMHPAIAQQEVQYQRRGNRSEGIKPRPVSGYDVELLSAVVDTPEDMSKLGAMLGFRFFLKEQVSVYPLVRELENKHYYVLDNVQPGTAWKTGFENVFEWPTGVVLGRLNAFKPSDLGIVVRLGKAAPSVDENVAPVVFYQSGIPSRVTGYRFIFSVRDDTAVTARVVREGDEKEVFTQRIARQPGGRPLVVKWAIADGEVSEGPYRMVLSGYFLANSKPIQQTVRFYHQPDIVGR
ncbi:MAG: hypothetical protein ABIS29_17470 [Vicinamibacterales bacterium]